MRTIKTSTVRRHAAMLRRISSAASWESMVPDAPPHDPPILEDLPAFTYIRIAAESQAGTVCDSLRTWIDQGGHQ